MIGTVSLSVACATLMDLVFPNFVFSWREKYKASCEKKAKLRRSYHHTKGRRRI
jgi:hypothetical protein